MSDSNVNIAKSEKRDNVKHKDEAKEGVSVMNSNRLG